MGQEATHPSHYTHVPFSIAFLHVGGKNYVKVLSHGPNSTMYYTTLRSSSVLLLIQCIPTHLYPHPLSNLESEGPPPSILLHLGYL